MRARVKIAWIALIALLAALSWFVAIGIWFTVLLIIDFVSLASAGL